MLRSTIVNATRWMGASTSRRPLSHLAQARASSRGANSIFAALHNLHQHSAEGPQPETLFNPELEGEQDYPHEIFNLEGEKDAEPKLPFPEVEKLREAYEQEQNPPSGDPNRQQEPDNPLPEELPPNHPKEPAPRDPPEIDPRVPQEQPDIQPQFPREIPDVTPNELPLPPPTELPPPSTIPEFTPPEQQGGGAEIQFPR